MAKAHKPRYKGLTWRQLTSEEKCRESLNYLISLNPKNERRIRKVLKVYPQKFNGYYVNLVRYPRDPIWLQISPDIRELEDDIGQIDSTHEDEMQPVSGLIHFYPSKVLFLISNICPMYCRFCTRKRMVGRDSYVNVNSRLQIQAAIEYIRNFNNIVDGSQGSIDKLKKNTPTCRHTM